MSLNHFIKVVVTVALMATSLLSGVNIETAAGESLTPVRRVIPHDSATQIGTEPTAVAVDAALHKAYVTNAADGTVSVVDTSTDTVRKVLTHDSATGIGNRPVGVAVDTGVHEAYVVNYDDGTVSVLNTVTDAVVTVIRHDLKSGIGTHPRGVAIDTALHRAWVCNEDGSMSIIDTTTHTAKTDQMVWGIDPIDIAIDEKTHRAYVATATSGFVEVFDTRTNIPLGSVSGVLRGARGVAVDANAAKVYVTRWDDGTVSVIDAKTSTVVKTIPHAASGALGIGTHPMDIAIDPGSPFAYVTNEGDGTVSIIDTISDVVTEVIGHDDSTGVGSAPSGVTVDAAKQRVYIANSGSGTVSVLGAQSLSPVSRYGGADRFETSATISANSFAPGVYAAYIASGENFPDALSASAVAGYTRSPVLLVTHENLPDVVAAELRRLKPKHIYIAGGPNSISDALATTLGGFAPVIRIGGADRFAVSANLSADKYTPGTTTVAYVASGTVFPDALSGSAAAGYRSGPMLLVTHDTVPTPVATELKRLHPQKIFVLGGTNAVGDPVLASLTNLLPAGTQIVRIPGADRYALSAAVSADTHPTGAATVYVASGEVFPDALSGSAAAIAVGAPVLLVTKDSIPASVGAELERLNPLHIVVLGGPNPISDALLPKLAGYVFTG